MESAGATESSEPSKRSAAAASGAASRPQADGQYTDLATFDVDRTEIATSTVVPKDAAVEALKRYAKTSTSGNKATSTAKQRKLRGGGVVLPQAATMQAGCMRSNSGGSDGGLDDLP